MSETRPRPWRAERRTYAHFDGTSDIAAILDANGVWFTPTPADAELIVRAVNQHDALVEFVEAVRRPLYEIADDQSALVAIDAALAAHDAKIGGQDD